MDRESLRQAGVLLAARFWVVYNRPGSSFLPVLAGTIALIAVFAFMIPIPPSSNPPVDFPIEAAVVVAALGALVALGSLRRYRASTAAPQLVIFLPVRSRALYVEFMAPPVLWTSLFSLMGVAPIAWVAASRGYVSSVWVVMVFALVGPLFWFTRIATQYLFHIIPPRVIWADYVSWGLLILPCALPAVAQVAGAPMGVVAALMGPFALIALMMEWVVSSGAFAFMVVFAALAAAQIAIVLRPPKVVVDDSEKAGSRLTSDQEARLEAFRDRAAVIEEKFRRRELDYFDIPLGVRPAFAWFVAPRKKTPRRTLIFTAVVAAAIIGGAAGLILLIVNLRHLTLPPLLGLAAALVTVACAMASKPALPPAVVLARIERGLAKADERKLEGPRYKPPHTMLLGWRYVQTLPVSNEDVAHFLVRPIYRQQRVLLAIGCTVFVIIAVTTGSLAVAAALVMVGAVITAGINLQEMAKDVPVRKGKGEFAELHPLAAVSALGGGGLAIMAMMVVLRARPSHLTPIALAAYAGALAVGTLLMVVLYYRYLRTSFVLSERPFASSAQTATLFAVGIGTMMASVGWLALS